MDVPCIHRVFNEAQFPDCPVVDFIPNLHWNQLIVEPNPLDDENMPEEISIEQIDLNFLIGMIHKNSKCKKKEKIEEYINPLHQRIKVEEEQEYTRFPL